MYKRQIYSTAQFAHASNLSAYRLIVESEPSLVILQYVYVCTLNILFGLIYDAGGGTEIVYTAVARSIRHIRHTYIWQRRFLRHYIHREAHAPFQIRYDFQISGIHRVFCFFLVVRSVVCGLTAVVVFCAAPADAGRLDLYSAVSSSECSNLHT